MTKKQKSDLPIWARALAGLVGFALLISLMHDISVDQFNNHGTPVRAATEPFVFWLNAAFQAVLGITGLCTLFLGGPRKRGG